MCGSSRCTYCSSLDTGVQSSVGCGIETSDIYRNIERVLPSIPWHPPTCFLRIWYTEQLNASFEVYIKIYIEIVHIHYSVAFLFIDIDYIDRYRLYRTPFSFDTNPILGTIPEQAKAVAGAALVTAGHYFPSSSPVKERVNRKRRSTSPWCIYVVNSWNKRNNADTPQTT